VRDEERKHLIWCRREKETDSRLTFSAEGREEAHYNDFFLLRVVGCAFFLFLFGDNGDG
jgi:hypothetical protein